MDIDYQIRVSKSTKKITWDVLRIVTLDCGLTLISPHVRGFESPIAAENHVLAKREDSRGMEDKTLVGITFKQWCHVLEYQPIRTDQVEEIDHIIYIKEKYMVNFGQVPEVTETAEPKFIIQAIDIFETAAVIVELEKLGAKYEE